MLKNLNADSQMHVCESHEKSQEEEFPANKELTEDDFEVESLMDHLKKLIPEEIFHQIRIDAIQKFGHCKEAEEFAILKATNTYISLMDRALKLKCEKNSQMRSLKAG